MSRLSRVGPCAAVCAAYGHSPLSASPHARFDRPAQKHLHPLIKKALRSVLCLCRAEFSNSPGLKKRGPWAKVENQPEEIFPEHF